MIHILFASMSLIHMGVCLAGELEGSGCGRKILCERDQTGRLGTFRVLPEWVEYEMSLKGGFYLKFRS